MRVARVVSDKDDRREAPDIEPLTRSLVAGDEAAYRVFFDAYYDRLARYLIVLTRGDEHGAQEALQETFRRVVLHIRVFTEEPIFWSWLTVLARSAHADHTRKRSRYFAFLERFKRYAPSETGENPANREQKKLSELLESSMSLLPSEERVLLEEKYFEHSSVIEIAARLQTTEKAVESRLVRVRKKLKAAIVAQLNHEPQE